MMRTSASALRNSLARRLSTSAYDPHALLHSSRIPTSHFQDSLPKLGVPKLEDTLKRFLYSAEPVVSAEALAEATALAAEFGKGEGAALQARLVAADAAKYSSYISEPWFDMYLRDRRPLLLNHNPQLTFKDEPSAERATQVGRAARLVHASATFLRTLEAGVLAPDVFHTNPKRSKTPWWPEVMRLLPRRVSFYGAAATGAYPLDMSQYANLFRSTRLPRAGRDELVVAAATRHIAVQRGGRVWKVPVLDADGGTLPLARLHASLQAVVDAADAAAAGAPAADGVGLLTTAGRDEWTAMRSALEASPTSAASLSEIDGALFMVNLDDAAPEGVHDTCLSMLMGNGTDRWFDKSFQLVVTANGKAALNFEHAWGDGVSVLRYCDEVHAAAADLPVVGDAELSALRSTAVPAAEAPEELSFEVPPEVADGIQRQRAAFDATVGGVDLCTVMTDAISSPVLKTRKVSPDGAMQMAFQLAHVRLKGYNASTYESASTSAFKHGRTETIRSATPESAAFAAAFCDANASREAKEGALRAAVKNHSRITKEALMGEGMDRHLFALRALAAADGATPKFFESEAYATLSKIILSTSTLSSPALESGGFGPVNADCYGIGYRINDEGAGAQVMTYDRDSRGFAEHLAGAMADMRAVLDGGEADTPIQTAYDTKDSS